MPISSKLFKLGKDYNLGDNCQRKVRTVITLRKNQLTNHKKTYDSKGLFVEPVFGKETPTVYDILGRADSVGMELPLDVY